MPDARREFPGRDRGGCPAAAFRVEGLPERMTVRELIRLRVREEVARHNARPSDRFNGLVPLAGG